jgi:hypothetical protein
MFRNRDAAWLAALLFTALVCLSVGFWLGDLRRQTVTDFEKHRLAFRVQRLEIALRDPGVPIPQDDD